MGGSERFVFTGSSHEVLNFFRSSYCFVTLRQPIRKLLHVGHQSTLIAQTFPSFGKVSLRNSCVLTCDGQTGGIGGILAFKARSLSIDHTSKIDMSGKGKWKLMI